MNLLDIEKNICRRLDKNAINLDAETKTRLDLFINDRYRELLRLDGINTRDDTYAFSTVGGRSRYVLWPGLTQIVSITNRTSGIKLKQRTIPWIREHDRASTPRIGTPTHYAFVNEQGIANQPTVFALNAMQIASTDATDVGAFTLEYESAAGSHDIYSGVLTGTAPVLIPRQIIYFYRLTMTAVPKGNVRVSMVPGTIEISTLSPNTALPAAAVHIWALYLWPQPNGVYALTIDAAHQRRELILPSDEPMIPEEFHTLLVWGGCSEECLKMDDNRRDYYEKKYQDDVKRLRAFLHQSRGERYIPTGGRGTAVSTLPGNYPASGD